MLSQNVHRALTMTRRVTHRSPLSVKHALRSATLQQTAQRAKLLPRHLPTKRKAVRCLLPKSNKSVSLLKHR
jgi:hypothetical protein